MCVLCIVPVETKLDWTKPGPASERARVDVEQHIPRRAKVVVLHWFCILQTPGASDLEAGDKRSKRARRSIKQSCETVEENWTHGIDTQSLACMRS